MRLSFIPWENSWLGIQTGHVMASANPEFKRLNIFKIKKT